MKMKTAFFLVLTLLSGLAACGGDGSSNRTVTADNPVAGLTQAVTQMQKAAEAVTGTKIGRASCRERV